jgi:putative ABC transport system substrate-binding protein
MRRRDFITLLSTAAAWPLAARAQQPAMPVIGFLNGGSPGGFAPMVNAFRQGLKETGYVEGQNVAIEYRWANDQYDRVAALTDDLVRRRVSVIAANSPANLAAKASTSTIPIVFTTGGDPVQLGLVASLSRPGGNVTGATQLGAELAPKRVELAHQLLPTATVIGLLVNPRSRVADTVTRDSQEAAATLGLRLNVLHASTEAQLDDAFATVQKRAGALVICSDTFFNNHTEQLAGLSIRHLVPAIYQYRQFAAGGGLISYGGSISESYRLAGVYTGRILKGEKPADLPVQQSTKIELFINLKTAKALGLEVPPTLLARADEVIE